VAEWLLKKSTQKFSEASETADDRSEAFAGERDQRRSALDLFGMHHNAILLLSKS
jgi:hypothetical protein